MKKSHVVAFPILILCCLSKTNVFCQYEIKNLKLLPRLKNGTTYVLLKDPQSEINKEYISVFKKYWEFNKIDFIKYEDVPLHISPENSFISLTHSSIHLPTMGVNSVDYHYFYVYFDLWAPTKHFLKKESVSKIKSADRITIGSVELFPYPTVTSITASDLTTDYDFVYNSNPIMRMWGPGILKNYIQLISFNLINSTSKEIFYEPIKSEELKILQNDTLYLPNYIMEKTNLFSEIKERDSEDILGDYPYKYKLLTETELNQKILKEKDPFYYLLYIISSGSKTVFVINASTGQIAYSNYTKSSNKFKARDLKLLSNVIKKK